MLYQGGGASAFQMPNICREMVVVIQGLVVLFAGAWRACSASRAGASGAPHDFPVDRTGRDDAPLTIRSSSSLLRHPARLSLILAALAGLFSERSGVVDIGLEGKILVAVFGSAAAATFTDSSGSDCSAASLSRSPFRCSTASPGSTIAATRSSPAWRSTWSLTADGADRHALWSQGGQTPELPADADSRRSNCRSPALSERFRLSDRSTSV